MYYIQIYLQYLQYTVYKMYMYLLFKIKAIPERKAWNIYVGIYIYIHLCFEVYIFYFVVAKIL